jgi:hypothetical protein
VTFGSLGLEDGIGCIRGDEDAFLVGDALGDGDVLVGDALGDGDFLGDALLGDGDVLVGDALGDGDFLGDALLGDDATEDCEPGDIDEELGDLVGSKPLFHFSFNTCFFLYIESCSKKSTILL